MLKMRCRAVLGQRWVFLLLVVRHWLVFAHNRGNDFGDQDREMDYDMEGVAETAATVPGVVVPAGTGDTTSRRRGRQPKIETEEEIQGKKRNKAAVEMIRRATKKTAVSALPTPERERTQGEERRKEAERKRASRAISNR